MYFIGDTHGLRPVFSIIDKHNLEGQNLIHVGDLGLGFTGIKYDLTNLETMDEMLIETNNNLFVIRGNHDNPIFWDRSKGLNLPKFHNLHLVDDYTVIRIEEKNVLFIGGALSIDRRPRMDDVPPTWWKDEVFDYDPVRLDKVVTKYKDIDIVVTHTAPDFCHPRSDNVEIVNHYHEVEKYHGANLKHELKEERLSMTEMYNELTLGYKKKPTHWFYGHFHSTKKEVINGTEFRLLNVNELYEIK